MHKPHCFTTFGQYIVSIKSFKIGALSFVHSPSACMLISMKYIHSYPAQKKVNRAFLRHENLKIRSKTYKKAGENTNTPRIAKTLTWFMIWKRTAIFAPGQLSISICEELEISKKRFSFDLTDFYMYICDCATEMIISLCYAHECSIL